MLLNEDAKDLICKDNWKQKNYLWTKEECATKCKGKWQLDVCVEKRKRN